MGNKTSDAEERGRRINPEYYFSQDAYNFEAEITVARSIQNSRGSREYEKLVSPSESRHFPNHQARVAPGPLLLIAGSSPAHLQLMSAHLVHALRRS
jgi:hypothetical protein